MISCSKIRDFGNLLLNPATIAGFWVYKKGANRVSICTLFVSGLFFGTGLRRFASRENCTFGHMNMCVAGLGEFTPLPPAFPFPKKHRICDAFPAPLQTGKSAAMQRIFLDCSLYERVVGTTGLEPVTSCM